MFLLLGQLVIASNPPHKDARHRCSSCISFRRTAYKLPWTCARIKTYGITNQHGNKRDDRAYPCCRLKPVL
eukprot:3763468-Amphidinium_carterae.1